jgi:hypothetical protein
MITPFFSEVEQQLAGLDRRREQIARRYIRRLALQPYLGYRMRHGQLADERCRALRFDIHDNPNDLLGGKPRAMRAGDDDLSRGPRWRIVYWVRETRDREIRVIVILAVGIAHPKSGRVSVFDHAAETLKTRVKEVE